MSYCHNKSNVNYYLSISDEISRDTSFYNESVWLRLVPETVLFRNFILQTDRIADRKKKVVS